MSTFDSILLFELCYWVLVAGTAGNECGFSHRIAPVRVRPQPVVSSNEYLSTDGSGIIIIVITNCLLKCLFERHEIGSLRLSNIGYRDYTDTSVTGIGATVFELIDR